MDEHNDRLMLIIGEISSDCKHILLRQDKQDSRLDRLNSRVVSLEKFQWKVVGIATFIPSAIAGIGLYFKY